MNNPFGIPDELFNIAVKFAVEQQKGQGKAPENPFKFDPAAAAKKSAAFAKQLYDAYVEAGFTAEQAFEMVKTVTARKN